LTVENLLNVIVGCSVVSRDLCDQLVRKIGRLPHESEEIDRIHRRVRAMVTELKFRLHKAGRMPKARSRKRRNARNA
jgi:hypothetical protein